MKNVVCISGLLRNVKDLINNCPQPCSFINHDITVVINNMFDDCNMYKIEHNKWVDVLNMGVADKIKFVENRFALIRANGYLYIIEVFE